MICFECHTSGKDRQIPSQKMILAPARYLSTGHTTARPTRPSIDVCVTFKDIRLRLVVCRNVHLRPQYHIDNLPRTEVGHTNSYLCCLSEGMAFLTAPSPPPPRTSGVFRNPPRGRTSLGERHYSTRGRPQTMKRLGKMMTFLVRGTLVLDDRRFIW